MFLPNEFAKVYEPESGLHQNDGRYFSNLRVIKEKAIPAQSGMASSNANGNRSKGFLTPWLYPFQRQYTGWPVRI